MNPMLKLTESKAEYAKYAVTKGEITVHLQTTKQSMMHCSLETGEQFHLQPLSNHHILHFPPKFPISYCLVYLVLCI